MYTTTKDLITIHDLAVETILGVYAWEQTAPRWIHLDITFEVDAKKAATSDDLANTIDYAAITERVCTWAKSQRFQLIESFAESVSILILKEFQLPWVKIKVSKPNAVPNCRTISCMIERRL